MVGVMLGLEAFEVRTARNYMRGAWMIISRSLTGKRGSSAPRPYVNHSPVIA
jgi:hypothetical protein